jgi:hypothetical protein
VLLLGATETSDFTAAPHALGSGETVSELAVRTFSAQEITEENGGAGSV